VIDRAVGVPVLLKSENLQRGGAFKLRGAYNALAVLDDDLRARGVFAYSSGNHAQGVAIAARIFGVEAAILMPDDTPPEKVAATRRHGAEVLTYDRYTEDREALGAQLAAERGAILIPPYDHDPTIAGQGTIALELFADADIDIASLIAPMGGGGLLAGCSLATPEGVAVLGAEPAERTSAREALRTGRSVTVPVPRTIADGQQTTAIGERPLRVLWQRAKGALGVTDAAIVAAMRLVYATWGLQVEPSGACALGALLEHDGVDGPVAVVVSGGNITPRRFERITAA
jgi:threonine dehydratase